MVLITTDSVSFLATDSGTGVLETRYSLDGAPEVISTGSFTLVAGTHTLAFREPGQCFEPGNPGSCELDGSGGGFDRPDLGGFPLKASTVTTARPLISGGVLRCRAGN